MTKLENEIHALLLKFAPESKVKQQLVKTKKLLDSSSQIVDVVDQLSDSLKKNIGKGMGGGISGSLSGWVAGKATKMVAGTGAGVVSCALKSVATLIPDASDPQCEKTDMEIATLIDTFKLPLDKDELFETLQWVSGQLSVEKSPFGEKTIASLKRIHTKIYNQLGVLAQHDDVLLKLAKQYAPKKKFGIF